MKTNNTSTKQGTFLKNTFWFAGTILAGVLTVWTFSEYEAQLNNRLGESNGEEITRTKYQTIKRLVRENPNCKKGKELISKALEGDSKIVSGEFYHIHKALGICEIDKQATYNKTNREKEVEEIRTLINPLLDS